MAKKYTSDSFVKNGGTNSEFLMADGSVSTGVELQANKGTVGGYASLDGSGRVPSSQLPSYVDDVVEVSNYASLPAAGEAGKIYITLDDNKTYRWSGSAYVEISESLALGETSSSAYRGDRGKIGYEHTLLVTGNPHDVTKSDIDLGNVQNLDTTTTENITDFTDKRFITDAQSTVLSNTSGANTGDETTSSVQTKLGVSTTATDGYLTSADWNIFNSKQPALISGTNIKTINGASLLGSGNIAISGGGGSDAPFNKAILLGSGNTTFGFDTQWFLMENNQVKTTGDDIYNGSNVMRYTPSSVAFDTEADIPTIVKIVQGHTQTYCLDSVGDVWAAGKNDKGCLGVGDTIDRVILTKISYFSDESIIITDIVPSRGGYDIDERSCFFLTSLGKIYGVGDGSHYKFGNGSSSDKSTPVRCGTLEGMTNIAVSGDITAVFAWDKNATGNNLYFWGYGVRGNLGNGISTNITTPTLATNISDVIDVQTTDGGTSSGGNSRSFSVALKSDKTVFYTGDNTKGQAGQGNTTALTTWTQIPNLSNIASILVTGGYYGIVIALDEDKKIHLIGNNSNGLHGDGSGGSHTSVFTPSALELPIQGSIDEIKIGGFSLDQTLLVRAGNIIYVSGSFKNGVRSNGTIDVSYNFERAMGISGNILQMEIYTSPNDVCQWSVRYEDGRVDACGDNNRGRTGTNTNVTTDAYYLTNVRF